MLVSSTVKSFHWRIRAGHTLVGLAVSVFLGSSCSPSSTTEPVCSKEDCFACVCATDKWCCTNEWDSTCKEKTVNSDSCQDACKVACNTCGDDFCPNTPIGYDAVGTSTETRPDSCLTEPTLSSLEATYFATTCTFSLCHNSTYRAGGLVLGEGQSYSDLVGVPSVYPTVPGMLRIAPGNPDESFLIHKVDFEPSAKGVGLTMPPGLGEPTGTDCAIPALRQWIEEGALNN